MTKDQRLRLIDTFRETIFDGNREAVVSHYIMPDSFEIDRFILKDICHLLNQYEREIINNEIQ
jgi:hypothetical protein